MCMSSKLQCNSCNIISDLILGAFVKLHVLCGCFRQRIFERALRESVFKAQEMLMNHAKGHRNAAIEIVKQRERELKTCIEECDAKIQQATQVCSL